VTVGRLRIVYLKGGDVVSFEVEFAGMFVGAEESERGGDVFRSLMLADGVETLRLYANRDSEDAFDKVKVLPPGTMVKVRCAIRTVEGKVKLRLLDASKAGAVSPAAATG